MSNSPSPSLSLTCSRYESPSVTMADASHCFYCREDLGGKRFVRSDGRPVCVRCHTKFCANSCAECHRPISVETKVSSPSPVGPRPRPRSHPVPLPRQELSHKGRYWHEECFRCAKCYKPLAREPFSTKDDRIMCGKCCSREDAPRCHGCYKPILAGETNLYRRHSRETRRVSQTSACLACLQVRRAWSTRATRGTTNASRATTANGR